jgi:hypothetical protein
MQTLTHDEIALHALLLWRDRGFPDGQDMEIWLEAERQLNEDLTADTLAERAKAAAAAKSEHHLSPAQTEQEAIHVAMQKDAARAPHVPHHLGPKAKPAETGKPLWTKPHGS